MLKTPNVIVFGGRAFETWLSHEGRALTNWINALGRGPPELPSATGGGSEMKAVYEFVYELECGSSPDTKYAGNLGLDFPASITLK